MTDPILIAKSFADSLTGYIAHDARRSRCRHCELAKDVADLLREVQAQAYARAAQVALTYRTVSVLADHEKPCCGEIAEATLRQVLTEEIAAAIRRLAAEIPDA